MYVFRLRIRVKLEYSIFHYDIHSVINVSRILLNTYVPFFRPILCDFFVQSTKRIIATPHRIYRLCATDNCAIHNI